MKDKNRKILQIIPANGWWAGYNGYADPDGGGTREGFDRLVCWALVEKEDDTTEVLGMIGNEDTEVRFADHHSFDKYLYSPATDPNETER